MLTFELDKKIQDNGIEAKVLEVYFGDIRDTDFIALYDLRELEEGDIIIAPAFCWPKKIPAKLYDELLNLPTDGSGRRVSNLSYNDFYDLY